MMVCPNDPNAIQRYVLAVFYYATQGWQWKSCKAPKDFACEGQISQANKKCNRMATPHFGGTRIGVNDTNAWLSPTHECTWGGIACYSESDPELAYTIDQIDFEDNDLRGELPDELSYLTNTRFLSLERGYLSGPIPTWIGALSQLLMIDFDFNEFTGNLPHQIYSLSKLRQLDLNDNKLIGTIGTEIGMLKDLEVLQIDHNSFEGEIPSQVGELEQLSKS